MCVGRSIKCGNPLNDKVWAFFLHVSETKKDQLQHSIHCTSITECYLHEGNLWIGPSSF